MKKIKKRIVVIGCILIILLFFNFVACNHAYKMTHFTETANQTPAPEELSFFKKLLLAFTGVSISKPNITSTPEDYGLQFETITFPGYQGFELEGWLLRNNSQRIIVMFHGYLDTKSRLLEEAAFFYANGFDVLLVDFSGYGNSQGASTYLGVKEAVDVERTFYYLKRNYDYKNVITYSVSMGSVAVMKAISDDLIVPDAVILECPFNTMLKTTINRFDSMNYPSFPFAHMLLFWGGMIIRYNAFHHNPSEYALKIDCPTLLLNGRLDKRVTISDIMDVYNNVNTLHKNIIIFDNAGHESYLHKDKEKWENGIREFIYSYIPL